MHKKITLAIEVLGNVILLLVILAVLSPSVRLLGNSFLIIVTLSLTGLILIGLISSTLRLLGVENRKFNFIFGFLLVIAGSLVFFFIPSFFLRTILLPIDFWYKVSFYSLPAICLEGGLFTLFTTHLASNTDYSNRERKLLVACLVLYLIVGVSANFLALNGIISINHQITFSQIVVIALLIVTAGIILKKKSS